MNRVEIFISRHFFAGCVTAAVLSIASLLWFTRAHYFNATNAGWGDAVQDRRQWLLGWGIKLSVLLALFFIGLLALNSRRALFSVISGCILSVLSIYIFWWVAPLFPRIPVIAWVFVFPGTVASLWIFGFHAGGSVPLAYALIVGASFYSVVAYFLLPRRFYTTRHGSLPAS